MSTYGNATYETLKQSDVASTGITGIKQASSVRQPVRSLDAASGSISVTELAC